MQAVIHMLIPLAMILTVSVAQIPEGAASDAAAEELAGQVLRAHGQDAWSRVTRVRFVFAMHEGDSTLIRASHDWDVRRNRATVEWNGKRITIDLANVGKDEDSKAAFARWTNDTYWLLAPLKLRDAGVILSSRGRENIDGQDYDVLRLRFEGVGLTPSDQYDFHIDPDTRLLARWTFMPDPQTRLHAIWTDYADFHGIKLARTRIIGERVIQFENLTIDVR